MTKVDIKVMKNKQRGSFVLEALIAILLFAIGILAIVGLQAASIGNAAGAKYRTGASLLANQIIGQMWVDDKTNPTLIANFCGPAASGVCATPGPMYLTWASSVAQALPGVSVASGTNMPSITIGPDNAATVTVRWQAANENATHNYSTVANIND